MEERNEVHVDLREIRPGMTSILDAHLTSVKNLKGARNVRDKAKQYIYYKTAIGCRYRQETFRLCRESIIPPHLGQLS